MQLHQFLMRRIAANHPLRIPFESGENIVEKIVDFIARFLGSLKNFL